MGALLQAMGVDQQGQDNTGQPQRPLITPYDQRSPQDQTMSMAGLLLASGMPLNKAIPQASQMMQHQQANQVRQMQMMMQMNKFQNQMAEQQANNDLINQISGGAPMSMPNVGNNPVSLPMGMPNPANNSPLDSSGSGMTLAQSLSNPSAPGAPAGNVNLGGANALPSQPQNSNNGGLFANVDPITKNIAINLIRSGDKAAGLKMLNDARSKELPGGFTKNAMMGPSRGGQGGTYTNPTTGEMISSNTNSMTTTDQSAIGATQRVIPQLEEVLKTLPQFQTASKRTEAWAQEMSNDLFGTNFKLPSERAKGEALIATSAEGLMKAFNLPSTNEALEMVKSAISPKKGESATAYEERLKAELDNLKMFSGQAKNRLAHGTVVQEGNNGAQVPFNNIMNPDNNAGTNTSALVTPNNNNITLQALLAERQRRKGAK